MRAPRGVRIQRFTQGVAVRHLAVPLAVPLAARGSRGWEAGIRDVPHHRGVTLCRDDTVTHATLHGTVTSALRGEPAGADSSHPSSLLDSFDLTLRTYVRAHFAVYPVFPSCVIHVGSSTLERTHRPPVGLEVSEERKASLDIRVPCYQVSKGTGYSSG